MVALFPPLQAGLINGFPIFYGFKYFFIPWIIGTHPPIPPVEIKAKVVVGLLVVHVVVGGCTQPLINGVGGSAFGCKLIACMSEHIEKGGPHGEKSQGAYMHWKYQC